MFLKGLELAEAVVVAARAAILQRRARVAAISGARQLAAVAGGRPRGVLRQIAAGELREGRGEQVVELFLDPPHDIHLHAELVVIQRGAAGEDRQEKTSEPPKRSEKRLKTTTKWSKNGRKVIKSHPKKAEKRPPGHEVSPCSITVFHKT